VLRTVVPLSLIAGLAACADPPAGEPVVDPNAGLLRDFLDGKFDGAGHPLNAKVIEAETACAGEVGDGAVTPRGPCTVELPEAAQNGDLMVNLRLRVTDHPVAGTIVRAAVLDTSGEVASEALTVERLREGDDWIDLAIGFHGPASSLQIQPQDGSTIELDYVEVFPKRFGLVIGPGSGVIGDDDLLTFELPTSRKLEALTADDADLLPALDDLVSRGVATRTSTAFRTLFEVKVGDLLPDRGDVSELRVKGAGDAARVQLRRTVAACNYEGDATGTKKVLITGFQPFPADGWHDNIAAVAVTAMDPAVLRGARVMRLVLPVEYDRAAAAITEVIDRCAPDAVISFGQGGNDIALEHTAYNLQDTGEISGGVPDNRGVIRGATPIDPEAPAERGTLLPIDAIRDALEAAGERPQDSTDPGRYICNNVMFQDIAAMGPRGGRAGFIHLPYTVSFDDQVRARFAKVVEAAVQATVDAP